MAGSSTLITSAPMSAKNMDAKGPDKMRVKSNTRMPSNCMVQSILMLDSLAILPQRA